MQTLYKLFLVFLICCGSVCFGQGSTFTRLPVVLFEDDFKSDVVGSFPAKWWIGHGDSVKLKKYYKVENIAGKRALVIYSAPEEARSGLLGAIAPGLGDVDYLPRRFSVEFDLFMSHNGITGVGYFAYSADQIFNISISATKGSVSAQHIFDASTSKDRSDWFARLPGFDFSKWHHIAMFYVDLQTTLYIDGQRIFETRPHRGNVRKLVIDFEWHQDIWDSVAYANFRLCADSNREASKFNRLLADSSFVSHAIVFDVDKTDIKGESIVVIAQLAHWLKSNPTIKLLIAGHTDNDGTPSANMTLSQRRADVVKQLLMSYGVAAERLTTKGYGDAKPVQPNTTPAGKAENRRVEFLRR